ncbi:serine/threonine protein kinase [Pendulispora rubella]|uniref:Serine/threonine protein kinase n=1 Tax=Pendulispora rubella TaxID=2741070 RepID=A0ABZ2LII6_9BACT
MAVEIENCPATEASPNGDPFQWVGHVLEGRYAVEALVGEGGFAVVYRGHHAGLDESVAIKCLKIPRKMAGEERDRFLRSFLDEGKLLYRLSRGNASIVRSLDVGVATSPNGTWTPYLVLEWLEGRTLEDDLNLQRRKGLTRTLAEARALLEPAARALGTAHAQGVAHRDIKPANLFLCTVDGKRTLKVLDFGIAKVIAESTDLRRAHEATGTSLQAFTPRYGAPEQFDRRFGATGAWTDVFALALILVEVVVGKSAMQGEGVELFLMASNLHERPTLRTFGVDEGGAVERVLARALAVHPTDRYAHANAFWDALTAAMNDGEAAAVSPRPQVDPLAQTVPSARDVLTEGPISPVPSGRTPVAMARSSSERGRSGRGSLPSWSGQRGSLERAVPTVQAISGAVPDDDAPAPSSSSARTMLPWIGLAAVVAVGGAWAYSEWTREESHYRALSYRGAGRGPHGSSLALESAGAGAMTCPNGLVPFSDDAIEGALCIPSELQNAPIVDGSLRQGDIELKLRGGTLRPPEVTLDSVFARITAEDAKDGGSVRSGSIEKSPDSFSFAGTLRGKAFFERTVSEADRFVGFQLVYPESARKVLEPKLGFMIPSFARRR